MTIEPLLNSNNAADIPARDRALGYALARRHDDPEMDRCRRARSLTHRQVYGCSVTTRPSVFVNSPRLTFSHGRSFFTPLGNTYEPECVRRLAVAVASVSASTLSKRKSDKPLT